MNKTFARFTLLVLLLTSTIFANPIINDVFLNEKAKKIITDISTELKSKTGINTYLYTTNDNVDRGVSMYDYARKFDSNLSKPYIILIFAPNNKRIGIIPSSENLKSMYNESDVKNNAIDVLKDENDGNKIEDKYNIAIVQSFSELSDEVAKSKGIELNSVLPNESHYMVNILRAIIYIGALFVFWIFVGRGIYQRFKNGRK
ncbi:MAG: hypothetical protein PHI02_07870 [Sulfurovaceae bacterium]|nr:hypothetical protein [Sulfurovaceae bacterium]